MSSITAPARIRFPVPGLSAALRLPERLDIVTLNHFPRYSYDELQSECLVGI